MEIDKENLEYIIKINNNPSSRLFGVNELDYAFSFEVDNNDQKNFLISGNTFVFSYLDVGAFQEEKENPSSRNFGKNLDEEISGRSE